MYKLFCFPTLCSIWMVLEKESSKQASGMQKYWEIVQKFQELTEDADTSTLLKECQEVVNKGDNRSKPRTRNLRIYVCESETNLPSISLKEDEDTKFELQKISSTVFYKDLKTVQGELSLHVQCTREKKDFSIKADDLVFVVPNPNQITTEGGAILNHLLDGVNHADTLQFALHVQKDIIAKGLKQLEQDLKKRMQQFEVTEVNSSSVLHFFFLKKRKEKSTTTTKITRQWPSWKWFEVISCIFEQYRDKLPPIIKDMLLDNVKPHLDGLLSKWDLFFLIPCLNYLSLPTTNNASRIRLSSRFQSNECSEWKGDDLDKKIISVLQTDLNIRRLSVIVPMHSEEYVLDLLVVQKDRKLSQSVLEFLFLQDKDVWDHIYSIGNGDKCWDVMLTAFQVDFKQWSRYLEHFNKIGVFEGGVSGSVFLSKFQTDKNFVELVTPSENFLTFLAFMQQQQQIM
ncbi:hypothetical protein RFI_38814 [Reticulomyxa filosa]|uniref:Uncharacterized protein n=1 Tax=Reticulomyxa filosa TaxID=46433 RepID=X6LAW4_RETFI|nr:hypothetical protein RFI_38814 [Reticulomyxa filosa]|eukprot:ETN98678.1 hypothetical protein RFI_38814 [Reticulomyxa filosa]